MPPGLLLRSARARGLTLVALAAVLWGTSGLAATVAYARGVEPLTVSFWRMSIGALALVPLVGRHTPTVRAWSWSDRRALALVALGLATYQAGFFLAVHAAGVSIATLFTLGLAPVFVTAAGRIVARQRAAPATLLGVALAVLGLVALIGVPADRPAGLLAGVGFAAVSAAGYAALALGGAVLTPRLGAPRLTVLSFAGAALALLPVTAVVADLALVADPVVIGAMAYLGVLPTAFAYRCFFAGLQHVPASTAAVVALLEPLTATALAIPLLGERLTPLGWSGAVTLLVAVALVAVAPAQRPAPLPPARLED